MLHRAGDWNRFALESTLEVFDRARAASGESPTAGHPGTAR
jgi:hypothetical protein